MIRSIGSVAKQTAQLGKRFTEALQCCTSPKNLDELSGDSRHSLLQHPATQPQLGELRAAVLQADHDFSLDDPRRMQTYQAIVDVVLSSTSLARDTEVLDDTIAALGLLVERLPVSVPDSDHPNAAALYDQYGGALLVRWRERSSDARARRDALDDAVIAYHRCVDLTPETDPSLIDRLRNLADAFDERFVRDGSSKDLDCTITAYRRCLKLNPAKHSITADLYSALGDSLEGRFDYHSRKDDLEDAIASYREAIEIIPDNDATKPKRLTRLADLLRRRSEGSDEVHTLDEAMDLLRRAVKLLPPGHAEAHGILASLAGLLEARFALSREESDMREACLSLMQAAQQAATPPLTKFGYAFRAVEILESYPFLGGCFPLLRAYECIIEAYPQAQIASLGKNIIERLRALSLLPFPARGAAATAIASGRLALAVEWLEEGRNVVWGQVFRLRNAADELREHHPDIADRLAALSRQLESVSIEYSGSISFFETSEHSGLPRVRMPEPNQGIQYKLAMEYEVLVQQIQSLDGFQRFLKPRPFAELVAAATEGPIVLVNLHERRSVCDALILLPAGNIVHVPLPRFSYAAAARLYTALQASLESGRLRGARIVSSVQKDISMGDILAALWKRVAQPVLSVLQGVLHPVQGQDLLHITWCLTGPLSFLPLHAAGIYNEGAAQVTLMDFAVSSYTPSIEVLLRSRGRSPSTKHRQQRVLAVAQPYALPHAPIPSTLKEVRLVRAHFPEGATLENQKGTMDAVLDAMVNHSWVHLACHGIQHSEDPTQSSFALHGGASLKLSQLMSLSLEHAELAFLSACQTATGNATVPDEAVHLAAGMLTAGFRSVVGTMWSVGDDDAPIVADAFYTALQRDIEAGRDARVAYALHGAVNQLRMTVGEREFFKWVPFVHFGR